MAASPSTASRDDDVLGPPAVRVISVGKELGGGVRISVVGPRDAVYGLRAPDGGVDSCEQTEGTVDAIALPGLPPNAVQHAQLSCATALASLLALTASGHLTVRVPAGTGFTYNFEVPARPPAQ